MHFTNKDPGYNNILKNIRRYMGPSKYPGTYLKVYWIEFKHSAPQCITYIHTCIFRCQIYTGVLLLLYQLTEYCTAWCVCKFLSFVLLAFARGIHQLPVDFPLKEPVMRMPFPWHNIVIGNCTQPTKTPPHWPLLLIRSSLHIPNEHAHPTTNAMIPNANCVVPNHTNDLPL